MRGRPFRSGCLLRRFQFSDHPLQLHTGHLCPLPFLLGAGGCRPGADGTDPPGEVAPPLETESIGSEERLGANGGPALEAGRAVGASEMEHLRII
jgi:hypothetical protein